MNDRGNIKWASLMLPEHVEMLKEYWRSTKRKEKPILDEQQIEDNSMKLQMAIHSDLNVEIKHFKDYDFHTVKGKLKSIVSGDCIVFDDSTRVKLSDVIDVFVV